MRLQGTCSAGSRCGHNAFGTAPMKCKVMVQPLVGYDGSVRRPTDRIALGAQRRAHGRRGPQRDEQSRAARCAHGC